MKLECKDEDQERPKMKKETTLLKKDSCFEEQERKSHFLKY